MMIARLLLPLCFMIPAAALASNSFQPPQGCETYLTVQARGCMVSQYYTCSADPQGDRWRADFDVDGIAFVSHIDSEAQWLESFEIFPPRRNTIEPSPVDPASFSNLIATGEDSFAFAQRGDDGVVVSYSGSDRLTGDAVVIDGVTLELTEFTFTERDDEGNELRTSSGQEFIHRDMRLFFGGLTSWEAFGETYTRDSSPVDFMFPGEPGFMSTEPLFDCEATMSSFTLPPLPEARHDSF